MGPCWPKVERSPTATAGKEQKTHGLAAPNFPALYRVREGVDPR
jgi:hypothetical protein